MPGRIEQLNKRSKPFLMVLSLALAGVIGLVDFMTGFELNFFAVYLAPVALAAWFIDRNFGFVVSVLCVAVSFGGDLLAGKHFSSLFVLVWNAAIALTVFFVVVWIVDKLRSLRDSLEDRVRRRTEALNREMYERMRLEEEILRISEHEQLRIGHDLHDSLCQHLTGIALAGQVLSEQLAKSPPQAEAVKHIVRLIEEAIELTRRLARGLHPVEMKDEGFADALQELAASISERFKTVCRFECPQPVLIQEPGSAIHLYRIAQEAATNAVKHGKAREIVIRIENANGGVKLSVADDGAGVPAVPREGKGMGLRIMAYRASIIGGTFAVERRAPHGTRIVCTMPAAGGRASETYAAEKQSLFD